MSESHQHVAFVNAVLDCPAKLFFRRIWLPCQQVRLSKGDSCLDVARIALQDRFQVDDGGAVITLCGRRAGPFHELVVVESNVAGRQKPARAEQDEESQRLAVFRCNAGTGQADPVVVRCTAHLAFSSSPGR